MHRVLRILQVNLEVVGLEGGRGVQLDGGRVHGEYERFVVSEEELVDYGVVALLNHSVEVSRIGDLAALPKVQVELDWRGRHIKCEGTVRFDRVVLPAGALDVHDSGVCSSRFHFGEAVRAEPAILAAALSRVFRAGPMAVAVIHKVAHVCSHGVARLAAAPQLSIL